MTTLRKKTPLDLATLEEAEQNAFTKLSTLDATSPQKETAKEEYVAARAAVRDAKKQSFSHNLINSALDELEENREKALERVRTVKTQRETPKNVVDSAVDDFVSANALVKQAKRRLSSLETPLKTQPEPRLTFRK